MTPVIMSGSFSTGYINVLPSRIRWSLCCTRDEKFASMAGRDEFRGLKQRVKIESRLDSSTGGFANLSALKEQMKFEKRKLEAEISLIEKEKLPLGNPSAKKGQEGVNLMVSNLSHQLTSEEYDQFMRGIPDITSWKYMSHKSGRCRPYGFCEVRPGADVAAVMEFISNQNLRGRDLKASLATSQPEQQTNRDEEISMKANPNSFQLKVSETGNDLHRDGSTRDASKTSQVGTYAGTSRRVNIKNTPNLLIASELEETALRKVLPGKAASKVISNLPISNETDEAISKKVPPGQPTSKVISNLLIPREIEDQASRGSEREGKLTGESVMASLERLASSGRVRTRRGRERAVKAPPSPQDSDSSDSESYLEFKPDWAEQIRALRARIEQLKQL